MQRFREAVSENRGSVTITVALTGAAVLFGLCVGTLTDNIWGPKDAGPTVVASLPNTPASSAAAQDASKTGPASANAASTAPAAVASPPATASAALPAAKPAPLAAAPPPPPHPVLLAQAPAPPRAVVVAAAPPPPVQARPPAAPMAAKNPPPARPMLMASLTPDQHAASRQAPVHHIDLNQLAETPSVATAVRTDACDSAAEGCGSYGLMAAADNRLSRMYTAAVEAGVPQPVLSQVTTSWTGLRRDTSRPPAAVLHDYGGLTESLSKAREQALAAKRSGSTTGDQAHSPTIQNQ